MALYRSISGFVERIAHQFNTGAFLAMTENYVFPLPIQMNGQMVVVSSADALAELMADHHAQSVAQGLHPALPRVVAMDLPRNGRFRVWTDWTFADKSEPEAQRTKTLYFCSTVGSRIQIEMVQYMRVAVAGSAMSSVFLERRIA